MEFSRQEYWSGLPFLLQWDLPDTGMVPGFPALQVDSLLSEPPGKPLCDRVEQFKLRIFSMGVFLKKNLFLIDIGLYDFLLYFVDIRTLL